MRVYEVSPIIKYSPLFKLTYFSKHNFEVGEVVEVEINKKKVKAVVENVEELKDAKRDVRNAKFQSKKIENGEVFYKFGERCFFELEKVASLSGVSTGEVLFYIDFIFDSTLHPSYKEGSGEILYYPDEFSSKIPLTPFERGSSAQLQIAGNKIFKILKENNLEKIIIKDFNFEKYINFQNPHLNKLEVLFWYLKFFRPEIKVEFESNFFGVCESYFLAEHKLTSRALPSLRGLRHASSQAYVRPEPPKKFFAKVEFDEMINKEVLEKIESAVAEKKKIFVFVMSHGYADRIFCGDCKKQYECGNCSFGYSILNEEEGRFLFCKNCKNKKTLLDDQYLICKYCGSWKMFPYGVGLQKVKELFPNSLFIDESQKKISDKKLMGEVESFKEGVLLGSMRILKAIKEKVDMAVVVSAGPLVRGENFDDNEKLLGLVSEIESITNEIYINKREGDEISLENYKDKNKFVKEELEIRKLANLPPFAKIVSIIFDYKNKRIVDKSCEKFQDKKSGEKKKGRKLVYFWIVPLAGVFEILELCKFGREVGEVWVGNSVHDFTFKK